MWNIKNNMRNKKGFTLAEAITAVGILVIVVLFASIIFRDSIEAYRLAGANAEIMQKLQTITTELDRDFGQIRKDGLLEIVVDTASGKVRNESKNSVKKLDVRMDRIYYFTTGDFQSWYGTGIRNNIARVYFGHDNYSLYPPSSNPIPLNKCRLARDVLLLTPEITTTAIQNGKLFDCNSVIFGAFASDPCALALKKDLGILPNSVVTNSIDPNNVRQIMCENVGELKIEWTDGSTDSANKSLIWYPLPDNLKNEAWWPVSTTVWPKALKFTFTLYDSKEILKEGRIFSHIVYLNAQ
jgi:type II secretory pathway pseudopilin PulG